MVHSHNFVYSPQKVIYVKYLKHVDLIYVTLNRFIKIEIHFYANVCIVFITRSSYSNGFTFSVTFLTVPPSRLAFVRQPLARSS